MQEENTSNSIIPEQDPYLDKLLNRTKILLPFQIIFLLIASFVFLPLLFSSDSESKGWAFLTLGPYILLSMVVFVILSILGFVNSIKLLKRKIVNGLSISVLFLSVIFFVAFIVSMIIVLFPIVSNNTQHSNQQKLEKISDRNKVDFFHERYVALSEEFKQPQIAYSYKYGQISLGFEDTANETGKPIPGKQKFILLGFALPDFTANSQKLWDERNNAVKGKPIKIVLPDEATFKASYSCDGPYQDCILSYPQRMPETEYFYAKVYLGDKLLNDDYTEAEQNLAQKGQGTISYQRMLYDIYNSYAVRFKSPQKVLSFNVGNNISLALENTNKVYPAGIGVDDDIFNNSIYVTLKDFSLDTPYSLIQQLRIEKFLNDHVVGYNIKITPPDFSEVQSSNQNFNNSQQKLSIQMNVQAYIEGESQSISDQLKVFIK